MKKQFNEEQSRAITIDNSSLLIVAGAGTGKTLVLTEKIARLLAQGIPDTNLLALTFTNHAADEMRKRIQHSTPHQRVPFIGTFHALSFSLLREFSAEAHVPEGFVIHDRDKCRRVIKACMKQADITEHSPRSILYAVGKIKTGLGAEFNNPLLDAAELVLPYYTRSMEEESALDFDDLILKTVSMLKREKTVRDSMQQRYSYIFVDEFQDSDILQNELIRLLCGEKTHVVAVGDTDQTIYTWRGAHVSTMLHFTERYTNADTVFLTKNYRSTGTILGAANAIISKNIFRQEKTLQPIRKHGAPIFVHVTKDEEGEAMMVAEEIMRLHTEERIPYNNIAILFRTNFQTRALETHMLSNRVPYHVLGARFFDRAEIKDLMAYLTLLQTPHSKESFIRVAAVPRRGIGNKTLERVFAGEESLLTPASMKKVTDLRNTINHLHTVAKEQPVNQVIKEIISSINYKEHLQKTYDNYEERMHEVHELIAFANQFSNVPGIEGIANLLAESALSSEQDSLRTGVKDAVRLMTAHAAKGMEFSHVFITGLEEGLFPFFHDNSDSSDPEEERRLCYVAVTRAKNNLHLSYATRRNIFGQYRNMKPSSFLHDIPDDLLRYVNHTEEEGVINIQW